MSDRKDDEPKEYRLPTIQEIAVRERAFLRRMLLRLGFRAADVDDVAQEVLLGVHKALRTFVPRQPGEPDGAIRGLMFAISRARAARNRQRCVEQFEIPVDNRELDQVRDTGVIPEEQYSLSERRLLLAELLAHIPPERRAVVRMYDIEQIPMAEIAEALGIPQNTAWGRRRRGFMDLRDAWSRLKARRK